MDKKYVIILGNGVEECYAINTDNSAEELRKMYKIWWDLKDIDDNFDVWIGDNYPDFEIERIFTETVYI